MHAVIRFYDLKNFFKYLQTLKRKGKKKVNFLYILIFCLILLQPQDSVTGGKHKIEETRIGLNSCLQKSQGHTIPKVAKCKIYVKLTQLYPNKWKQALDSDTILQRESKGERQSPERQSPYVIFIVEYQESTLLETKCW